ncbi:MAG: hypothetical protein ACJAQU_000315 [Loktanella salsilacus]|jgi:hypothetical protein
MTTIADHYIPTNSFDELVATLMNLPAHFDRCTQIIELLLGVGVAPMSCLADRDAAEMAQADMAAVTRHITTPLSDADQAAFDSYLAMQTRNYAAQIEIAKDEELEAQ